MAFLAIFSVLRRFLFHRHEFFGETKMQPQAAPLKVVADIVKTVEENSADRVIVEVSAPSNASWMRYRSTWMRSWM